MLFIHILFSYVFPIELALTLVLVAFIVCEAVEAAKTMNVMSSKQAGDFGLEFEAHDLDDLEDDTAVRPFKETSI